MRRPERRNRKSGTKDFGWRKQNEMGVPDPWTDRDGEYRPFSQRLEPDSVEEITINGHKITFISESAREDCAHACSVADIVHLLSHVPERDLEDLDIIAFRQPTRKDAMLHAAWGRLCYFADIKRIEGSAIILDAQSLAKPMFWSRRLGTEERREYERLLKDGHTVTEQKRGTEMQLTPEPFRNTVLYRTVLHELGHWVDYMRKIMWTATMIGEDFSSSHELYFSRPSREREDFAHRYAQEQGAKLRADGVIPFAPR